MEEEIPGGPEGGTTATPLPPPERPLEARVVGSVVSVAPLGVRALAGLEVGIVGGLLMLAWFMADAWLHREFLWKLPHLFASLLYGDDVFHARFGMITLAGISMLLVSSGSVGLAFGCLIRRPSPMLRFTVVALIVSMSWYWFTMAVVWRQWLPLFPAYVLPYTMVVAHILYGIALAQYSRVVRLLARALHTPSVLE